MPGTDRRKPLYTVLYVQVIVAIVIGVLLGYVWPETGAAMRPLGDGFIRLVRMMIAPIIFSVVVVGIAKIGDLKAVGRIGLKALIYFEVISTLALVIGLVVVNILKPGEGINADPASLDPNAVSAYATSAESLSTVDFLLNIIPTTVVGAFATGADSSGAAVFGDVRRRTAAAWRTRSAAGVSHRAVLARALFKMIHMIMRARADRCVRRYGVHDRPLSASGRCCSSDK